MSLECSGTLTQSQDGAPLCDGVWSVTSQNTAQLLDQVVTSLDSLNANLNDVFNFDQDVFGVVLLASILSFITGHVLGVVTRQLNRT